MHSHFSDEIPPLQADALPTSFDFSDTNHELFSSEREMLIVTGAQRLVSTFVILLISYILILSVAACTTYMNAGHLDGPVFSFSSVKPHYKSVPYKIVDVMTDITSVSDIDRFVANRCDMCSPLHRLRIDSDTFTFGTFQVDWERYKSDPSAGYTIALNMLDDLALQTSVIGTTPLQLKLENLTQSPLLASVGLSNSINDMLGVEEPIVDLDFCTGNDPAYPPSVTLAMLATLTVLARGSRGDLRCTTNENHGAKRSFSYRTTGVINDPIIHTIYSHYAVRSLSRTKNMFNFLAASIRAGADKPIYSEEIATLYACVEFKTNIGKFTIKFKATSDRSNAAELSLRLACVAAVTLLLARPAIEPTSFMIVNAEHELIAHSNPIDTDSKDLLSEIASFLNLLTFLDTPYSWLLPRIN